MKNIGLIVKYLTIATSLTVVFFAPCVSQAAQKSALQVSCYPNSNNVQVNSNVGWYSNVSGGNGYYTYSWSGADSLYGSGMSVLKTYFSSGLKTASLTVTSDGYTASANCGSVYVYDNNNYYYGYPTYYSYAGNLNGSCSADVTTAQVGQTVNWSGSATGGVGTYAYSWVDSEGYTSAGQFFSRYYTTPGMKTTTFTVYSNGQSIVRTCSVYVSSNTDISSVKSYSLTPSLTKNTVLAYNDSNSNSGVSTSSVYLTDVPYTGFNASFSILFFVVILVVWSSILAYFFLKDRIVSESKVLVTEQTIPSHKNQNSYFSKDENDIKKIEDYARLNKVLLSRDASIALLKLFRTQKIDISKTLKKVGNSEWIAIGEADLEKLL